jgi:hypothetical protein
MLPRQWVLLRQWQRRHSLEIEVFELVERAQVGQEAPELLVIQQVVAAEGQGGGGSVERPSYASPCTYESASLSVGRERRQRRRTQCSGTCLRCRLSREVSRERPLRTTGDKGSRASRICLRRAAAVGAPSRENEQRREGGRRKKETRSGRRGAVTPRRNPA